MRRDYQAAKRVRVHFDIRRLVGGFLQAVEAEYLEDEDGSIQEFAPWVRSREKYRLNRIQRPYWDSLVKEALEDNQVSADLYDALDEKVAGLLEDAAQRAEANDRKTVQSHDL